MSGSQLARRTRSFQPLAVLARRLRTQAQPYDYVPREELDDHPLVRSAGLATPRQVFLSQYLGKEMAHRSRYSS
ncbi:hypothetical protein J3R82DRAFT_4058 [Butyriboletus roseoflavus]|nr:hypothetical protein J3R82DRAFT_4058 [Butyriboletus roseoflavus]